MYLWNRLLESMQQEVIVLSGWNTDISCNYNLAETTKNYHTSSIPKGDLYSIKKQRKMLTSLNWQHPGNSNMLFNLYLLFQQVL